MASEMKNIAGLFSNSKTRLVIFFTAFIIIIILAIVGFSVRKRFISTETNAKLANVPGSIQSIPGSTTPTVQYARLQNTENVLVAERALKKGTSAIPTIIKSEKVEGPVQQGGESSVGFSGLLNEEGGTSTKQLLEDELRKSHCSFQVLQKAKAAGFTLQELKDAGCKVCQLKQAGFDPKALEDVGFSACDLKNCGFTAKDLLNAGMTHDELKGAGFKESELQAAAATIAPEKIVQAEKGKCDVVTLRKAREQGVSAGTLRRQGCSAAALKAAGYTAQELKDAGFSAAELRAAGFTAQQLKDAGFNTAELKAAGFLAPDLRAAGLTARQLLDAGFNANDLRAAGYSQNDIAPPTTAQAAPTTAATQQNAAVQQVLARQAQQISAQQYQQQVNQIKAGMQGQAQQLFSSWQGVSNQSLVAGTPEKEKENKKGGGKSGMGGGEGENIGMPPGVGGTGNTIKAGAVIYAVLNTAVNSDEPSPVLATVVGGKYAGARLVGSLATTGQNAQKLILRFNLMSLPDQEKSISINAVAIDPKTARTALSSDTDNHYIQRFGLVFAASFLQGLGQAVSTSGATVTQNSQGQTTATNATLTSKQKAEVALGQVGQTASQIFSKDVNRPPTIQVYSGVGLGILFLGDVDVSGNQSQG